MVSNTAMQIMIEIKDRMIVAISIEKGMNGNRLVGDFFVEGSSPNRYHVQR